MRGKFITFEGIDGAGKSTHIGTVRQTLESRALPVVVSREPGGTPLAERIREMLLNSAMSAQTELLLAFAARRDHLEKVIRPALDSGRWVICDRFTDSTFAYQGGGRGVGWEQISWLETVVQEGVQPDLTFWFDLPAEEAARRRARARTADRFEAEDLVFFERVRLAYQRRLQENPQRVIRIDASKSIEDITKELCKRIASI